MNPLADRIIDALGGTTAVARLTAAPVSTVHSWRRNGLPASRLAHLRLAAAAARIPVDLDALAERARREAAGEGALPLPGTLFAQAEQG